MGFLLHEGVDPVRLKAFYLSDDDLLVLSQRARKLREAYAEAQRPPLRLVEEGGEA